MATHEQLEELVLDRATYEVKKDLGNKFAQIVLQPIVMVSVVVCFNADNI